MSAHAYAGQDAPGRLGSGRRAAGPPTTGRIPIAERRGGPPAPPKVSSTPLFLRATVAVGLLAAVGVSAVRVFEGGGVAAAGLAIDGRGVTTVAAAGGAVPEASCRVRHAVTSRTAGRFTSVVTVSNTGSRPIEGWTLTWTYPGAKTAPRLTDGWNANVSSDVNGGQATSTDLSRVIARRSSTTIGFVGSASGQVPAPATFALNGVTCR